MSKTSEVVAGSIFGGLFAFWFIAAILMFIGWIMNIFKLIGMAGEEVTWGALEVLRVVGVIVAPIGGVMGWM